MSATLLGFLFLILVSCLEESSTSPVALPQDQKEILHGTPLWQGKLSYNSVLWHNHGKNTNSPKWHFWKWWGLKNEDTNKDQTVDNSQQVGTDGAVDHYNKPGQGPQTFEPDPYTNAITEKGVDGSEDVYDGEEPEEYELRPLDPGKIETDGHTSNVPETNESNLYEPVELEPESNLLETVEPEHESNFSEIVEPQHEPDLPETGETEHEYDFPKTVEPEHESSLPEIVDLKNESDFPKTVEPEHDSDVLETAVVPEYESELPETVEHGHEHDFPEIAEPEHEFGLAETIELEHGSDLTETVESEYEYDLSESVEFEYEYDLSETVESEYDSYLPETVDPKHEFDFPEEIEPEHESKSSETVELEHTSDLPETDKSEFGGEAEYDWTRIYDCMDGWFELDDSDWSTMTEFDLNEFNNFGFIDSDELGTNEIESDEYDSFSDEDKSENHRGGTYKGNGIVKKMISFWHYVLGLMLHWLGL